MRVDRYHLHAIGRGIPKAYKGAACFLRYVCVNSLMVSSRTIMVLLKAAEIMYHGALAGSV